MSRVSLTNSTWPQSYAVITIDNWRWISYQATLLAISLASTWTADLSFAIFAFAFFKISTFKHLKEDYKSLIRKNRSSDRQISTSTIASPVFVPGTNHQQKQHLINGRLVNWLNWMPAAWWVDYWKFKSISVSFQISILIPIGLTQYSTFYSVLNVLFNIEHHHHNHLTVHFLPQLNMGMDNGRLLLNSTTNQPLVAARILNPIHYWIIIIISLTSIFFQDQSRVWTAASHQH